MIIMVKPELLPLQPVNPQSIQGYDRYLPTAFDGSLSLLEKINKMIYEMNKISQVTNGFIEMWNKLLDWIVNEGLEDMVNEKLGEWLKDGTLEDIISDLLGNYFPKDYLEHQEVFGSVPNTERGEEDFIQGFSFNQQANEFYVSRKDNDRTDNIIYKYDLKTFAIKEAKRFSSSVGAYNEGLPYFYNSSDDLCFIVRTAYDHMTAIFNYRTGTLDTPFPCPGSSKHGMDNNQTVYFTHFGDAARVEGIFLYDLDSVKNGNPTLLRKIYFPNSIAEGEKIQSMTIIDDLIYVGHGKEFPQVSVINYLGDVLYHHEFDKQSLLNVIKKNVGNLNLSSFQYENEGMNFYKENDKIFPVMGHCILEMGRTYLTKLGNPIWDKVETDHYTTNVNGGVTWKDVKDFGTNVTNYGDDVTAQYMKDDKGFVELRGVVTYPRENTNPTESYGYDKILFTLPYPYKPFKNSFHSTVASGGADRRNKITVNKQGQVILNSVYDQGGTGKPFCSLDGIRFYIDSRPL